MEPKFDVKDIRVALAKTIKDRIQEYTDKLVALRKGEPTPSSEIKVELAPNGNCPLCGNGDAPGSCTCLAKNSKGEWVKDYQKAEKSGSSSPSASSSGSTGEPAQRNGDHFDATGNGPVDHFDGKDPSHKSKVMPAPGSGGKVTKGKGVKKADGDWWRGAFNQHQAGFGAPTGTDSPQPAAAAAPCQHPGHNELAAYIAQVPTDENSKKMLLSIACPGCRGFGKNEVVSLDNLHKAIKQGTMIPAGTPITRLPPGPVNDGAVKNVTSDGTCLNCGGRGITRKKDKSVSPCSNCKGQTNTTPVGAGMGGIAKPLPESAYVEPDLLEQFAENQPQGVPSVTRAFGKNDDEQGKILDGYANRSTGAAVALGGLMAMGAVCKECGKPRDADPAVASQPAVSAPAPASPPPPGGNKFQVTKSEPKLNKTMGAPISKVPSKGSPVLAVKTELDKAISSTTIGKPATQVRGATPKNVGIKLPSTVGKTPLNTIKLPGTKPVVPQNT